MDQPRIVPVMLTIQEELRAAGAHYTGVNGKGTKRYRLPWGLELHMGKGAAEKLKFLSELRHAVAAHTHVPEQPVEPARTPLPAVPLPPPVVAPPPFNPLITIDRAINEARKRADEHLAAAGREEKRITLLEAMRVAVSDLGNDALETTLHSVLPAPPAPPPAPAAPPVLAPGERIVVTTQRVTEIAKSFGAASYNGHDVVAKLIGDLAVDDVERKRVKLCVMQNLWSQSQRGLIHIVQLGAGKRAAIYDNNVQALGALA